MGKTVVIVQSNYIPWKGYFDLINLADEVILLDAVQYTPQDWRNRNRIKTPGGPRWLTIPVVRKGSTLQRIDETRISDPGWSTMHLRRIAGNYAGALHFEKYRRLVEEWYAPDDEHSLSRINRRFIERICQLLGISTRISRSSDYELVDGKTERLVSLCRQAGATVYLSGPAARAYLEAERFEAAGIELRYMEYTGYPEYRQLYPPFEHRVTVLDLIFNEGPDAPRYMKSF